MFMRKKHVSMIIIFVILVGSDLFLGFSGHYAGATGNDFELEAFREYLTTVEFKDLLPVFILAILIFLVIEWRFGAL